MFNQSLHGFDRSPALHWASHLEWTGQGIGCGQLQ
jgi:hypothetical protein